jgi:hypothetical protein
MWSLAARNSRRAPEMNALLESTSGAQRRIGLTVQGTDALDARRRGLEAIRYALGEHLAGDLSIESIQPDEDDIGPPPARDPLTCSTIDETRPACRAWTTSACSSGCSVMPPTGCLPSNSEQLELLGLLRGDGQLGAGSRGVDLGGCPLLLDHAGGNGLLNSSRDLLGP